MQGLPFTSIALSIWNSYITLGYGTPILSVQSMGVIEWNLYRGAICCCCTFLYFRRLIQLPFCVSHFHIPFSSISINSSRTCVHVQSYHANLSILLCACTFGVKVKCICPWTKCDCNQEKQQAYQFCGSVLISFANNSYLFFKAKVSIA